MLNIKIFIPYENVVILGYYVRMEEAFGIPPVKMASTTEEFRHGCGRKHHKENSGFITTSFVFSH